MQIRSVVIRLWLAFIALILVVMVPLELGLHRLLTDFYGSQVTERLLYHSQQLAYMLEVDPTSLQLAPMMGQMVGGEVMVVDGTGNPISFPGSSTEQPPSAAVAVALRGATFSGQVTLGDGQAYIVTAVPMHHSPGAVLLLAPAEPVQQSLTLARRYLWAAGAGTLLMGTGLALMLSRGLLRPIIAIERATRSIAQGDFSTRVAHEQDDEIGRLATAVNQMTGQLAAHETRRREFLANVAHELRTPLSYIRGYTQAMAEGLTGGPENAERYHRIIHEEAVRVGRLVDDLMDIAQMEEGQMTFDLTELDIRVPIGQAAATIAPIAEAKGVRLAVDLPAGLPRLMADAGRIQQVALNLLDNGLQHTESGGMLRVTASASKGWVTVRVSDTGEGIEPELLPVLFERFYKRRSSGRGLGLSIVRSIVRAHGGEVGAENNPSGGAAFWFRLPVANG